MAIYRDRTRGRGEEAGDNFHCCRFAGAIGPQKSEHLALGHRKTQVVYGGKLLELFA